jgi:hypothetical protein
VLIGMALGSHAVDRSAPLDLLGFLQTRRSRVGSHCIHARTAGHEIVRGVRLHLSTDQLVSENDVFPLRRSHPNGVPFVLGLLLYGQIISLFSAYLRCFAWLGLDKQYDSSANGHCLSCLTRIDRPIFY